MGLSGRTKFLSGDFFQAVPTGADAIIMKSIIHDWNDERSLKILENCRRALPENGKLLLVERIMPELPSVSDENREQAMSDLNMLRGPGGLERTEKKYGRLLDAAGFRQLALLPAGLFSVIEARVC
jgi:O-methyltransferase domain